MREEIIRRRNEVELQMMARCKKYRDRQPRDIGIFKDQRVSDPKKPVI